MKVERNNFEYSQTGNKDVKSPEKETLNAWQNRRCQQDKKRNLYLIYQ